MIELLIVGATASALVQFLKNRMGTSKAGTLLTLVAVSVILAGAGTIIMQYDLWEQFVGIIATANLIYSFLIQHVEEK